MNRTVYLTESIASEVELSDQQAQSTIALGRALASKVRWWGSTTFDYAEDERTVIACEPRGTNHWRIVVSNAIGAFGVGTVTFIVRPKISLRHVLYLFSVGAFLPRLEDAPTTLDAGTDLWELLSRWFIARSQEVICRDLVRDYRSTHGSLSAVRGQIDATPSAAQYYSGSLDLICTHDDFTVDNSYNRVLLAALDALQGLDTLRIDIRRDSRRLSSYFEDVGPLRGEDLGIRVDRRTAYYGKALALAKLIISATALGLSHGSRDAWTFLVATPEPMEAGIRAILASGMLPTVQVSKYETRLAPSNMSIAPDLRFDPVGAVGDVKYKVYGNDWPRADLYQSVAFAVGCHTLRSCVISFTRAEQVSLPTLCINIR